jgi:hypothetical protein
VLIIRSQLSLPIGRAACFDSLRPGDPAHRGNPGTLFHKFITHWFS